LVSYSQGSVIGSGTENIALEIKPAVTQELLVLDIRIEFSGIFGNRYLKEIFCIPRDGIEKHMFIAPKIINSITQAHI